MKGYLHIGTPKTATTTIQEFLAVNKDALLANGTIYTSSAGEENNFYVALAAYNADRRDELTRLNHVNSDSDLITLQKQIIDDLKTEIAIKAKLVNNNANVILSSEFIHLLLRTPEELARLKSVLHEIGIDDIEIIVYLRNPADLAASYFSTSVKMGVTHDVPQSPEQDRYQHLCDHKGTIERFTSVFGKDKVTPRLFEKSLFYKDSIVADFLHTVGISDHENLCFPPNTNLSLSVEGIQIQRRLNRFFPRWTGNQLNPLRPLLAEQVDREYGGRKYIMPTSLQKDYNQQFQKSNEWVRSKYFPERSSLFTHLVKSDKDPLKGSEKPSAELDELAISTAIRFLADIKSFANEDVWQNSQPVILPYGQSTKDKYSTNFDILLNLSVGEAEYNIGNFMNATTAFELVLKHDNKHKIALTYKAMCLTELGEHSKADNLYRKLISLYPRDLSVRRAYAMCAELKEGEQETASRWRAAVHCAPENREAVRKCGVWSFKANQIEEALACFDALISWHSTDTHALYFKARCLVELKQYDRADQILIQIISLAEATPAVFQLHAIIAEKKEHWNDAASRWSRAEQRFPDQIEFGDRARQCHEKQCQKNTYKQAS